MSGFFISKTDVLSFFVSLSDGFSVKATSQAILELVVIGRIPLTNVQVDYEALMVPVITVLWTIITVWLVKSAINKLDTINFQNYIEQIAL